MLNLFSALGILKVDFFFSRFMPDSLPQCANLSQDVQVLLDLFRTEPSLRNQQDTTGVETSLKKAISPRFEIVFAGAFSAGKSMLINALLERELLYSAEGHATGTECYIDYATPDQERVVLTFLSEREIQEQITNICQRLNVNTAINFNEPQFFEHLTQYCQKIIDKEGGKDKAEIAKQAYALILLIEGYIHNKERIHQFNNATYSMAQFNFNNLAEAAQFARRGSSSAVLKKVEYYCNHPLLEDGNVLVDTPGIDAPVQKDADLAFKKIEHPDTSAVVCVLKAASTGELAKEETELLDKIRSNPGIRDRVFYLFNRIDQTWFAAQLRQRLDSLIQSQFNDTPRIYRSSGLLGFYGSQVKNLTSKNDRFGLNSIFVESVKNLGGEEDTPQFVSEFLNYCANANKLRLTEFRVHVNGFDTPNDNYVRILSEWGQPLLDKLIIDSGIQEFRSVITKFLTEEKRPQLFANLADDLQPFCISLRQHYLDNYRHLESQPREIEGMKAQELNRLNQELQEVGEELKHHLINEVNTIIVNADPTFEQDFQKLRVRMVGRLDELINTFSVANAYSRATLAHPRNACAPFIAILVEALYYLANELEDVLVEESKYIVNRCIQRLIEKVRQADYYRKLYRLLGDDGGIEEHIKSTGEKLINALVAEAKVECDRYVRESPRFYDENIFSISQFKRIQQAAQGYDCAAMVEAQPAIRQLLKLEFEPKVSATIRVNFRQAMNQTIKVYLLPMSEKQAENILQQHDKARAYLEQSLEKEAQDKIDKNAKLQMDINQKINCYNVAVNSINSCLQFMGVYERQLPIIADAELKHIPVYNNEELI
jgi:replication fork clamp-binding protein CrfC